MPTLRIDNDAEIPSKITYIKGTEWFRINDIDINKIRVSDKKLYNKKHNVVGCYNDNSKYDFKYSAERLNFKLDGTYLKKIRN